MSCFSHFPRLSRKIASLFSQNNAIVSACSRCPTSNFRMVETGIINTSYAPQTLVPVSSSEELTSAGHGATRPHARGDCVDSPRASRSSAKTIPEASEAARHHPGGGSIFSTLSKVGANVGHFTGRIDSPCHRHHASCGSWPRLRLRRGADGTSAEWHSCFGGRSRSFCLRLRRIYVAAAVREIFDFGGGSAWPSGPKGSRYRPAMRRVSQRGRGRRRSPVFEPTVAA